MKRHFVSAAARELSKAITYYESIAPTLGERFRTDIESTLDRIIANPLAWAPFGNHLRRCRTTHFPTG